MGWNYRVLALKDGDYWYFQIHEVYYDKDGKPNGYSANCVGVGSSSLKDLEFVLDQMEECLSKPILSYDNFPEEWKEDK